MPDQDDVFLYHREGAYIPRVAAVHDLCGYGKCSLGVAIPVLSAAGCDVCPVPTSLFSAHTKFPTFYMHDTTPMLHEYLDAWDREGVEVDAIYSGFLGSAQQVLAIQRLYREHPNALRIVDPVMGDGGQKYPTYTDEMCQATAGLVYGADLLTPNLTEASILTHLPYEGQSPDDTQVARMMDGLLAMGARYVVLKGIVRGGDTIVNFVGGRNMGMAAVDGRLLPFMIHGTGDLYASSLLAAIMCGHGLVDAAGFAGTFVRKAMEVTRRQPDYQMRGVSFETVLGDVTALVG